MRTCPRCKHDKPLTAYYDNSSSKSGKRTECKECTKYAVKKAYPEQGKFAYIERAYGIDKATYLALYEKQKGLCAICQVEMVHEDTKSRAVVDHCHETGKVRGLLCHLCNCGLGMFRDRENSLFRALTYLQRTQV